MVDRKDKYKINGGFKVMKKVQGRLIKRTVEVDSGRFL